MFKSSKGALIFAGLVVLGAVSLVGVEDDPGTVVETSDDISRQKAELDAMIESENSLVEEVSEDAEAPDGWFDEDVEFLEDDDLIDDAEGFDPAPMLDPSSPEIDRGEDDAIVYGDG